MRKYIAIALLSLLASPLYATMQVPDVLIFKGQRWNLRTYVIEQVLSKRKPSVAWGENGRHKDIRIVDAKGDTVIVGDVNTAYHRGYLGVYEIGEDKRLYLNDMLFTDQYGDPPHFIDRGPSADPWSIMHYYFPGQGRMALGWYSGLLLVPYGTWDRYYNEPRASNYMILEITDGVLTGERDLTWNEFEDFKKRQFEAFKNTDEYNRIFEDWVRRLYRDQSVDRKNIDETIEWLIIDYSKKILTD